MPLLCEGKYVSINIEDSLEILTEEEYIILDTLLEKVLSYSNKKQTDLNSNRLITYLGKQFIEEEIKKQN